MLNSNQIQEIIPHRYPMLLIDRVDEMEVGKYAIATKAVTANEPFFQGHFPRHHVMPGVLIVEALAQTGAVCLLSKEENEGKIAFFASINKMKFKRQVLPGDVLTLKVEIIKSRGFIGVGKVVAEVDDEIAAIGELTFALEK